MEDEKWNAHHATIDFAGGKVNYPAQWSRLVFQSPDAHSAEEQQATCPITIICAGLRDVESQTWLHVRPRDMCHYRMGRHFPLSYHRDAHVRKTF